ncbi:MAG: transglutaminase-like domain-containing protein, partial [Microgenomates group bacterium]
TVIFSLPPSNGYQKITNLKIDWQDYQIIEEKQWGNKVVVLRLNDVKKNFSQISFNLSSSCFTGELKPSFSIDNYQNKKFKIINDRFINGKNPQIKKFARQIVGKEKNLQKIIKKLYSFTLDYLTYGKPIEGLYSHKQALKEKITDCGGFSTFLASLLQSINIPSRLIIGFLIKKNIIKYLGSMFYFSRYTFHDLLIHAWLEALLPDGSWFPLDPSIEWRRNKGLTKREGGFGFVPDDRLVISYGEDFKIKIDNKIHQIDILQNPVYI